MFSLHLMNSTIMKLHSKYSKISTKERFRTSNFFKKTKFRSPVFRYQKSSIWSSTRFLEKHGWFLEMAILVLHSPPVRSLPPSMFHHQPWMVSSNFTNTWGGILDFLMVKLMINLSCLSLSLRWVIRYEFLKGKSVNVGKGIENIGRLKYFLYHYDGCRTVSDLLWPHWLSLGWLLILGWKNF